MPIKLEIVTPERMIFSDDVDAVLLPGIEGELGVLPQHAPLVTTLTPGELRYTINNKETEFAVGEGFVEVTQTRVAVLTDMAVTDAEIDESVVEAALKSAEDALSEKTDAEEIAAVQAAIQKSMAQLHLKRKRRHL